MQALFGLGIGDNKFLQIGWILLSETESLPWAALIELINGHPFLGAGSLILTVIVIPVITLADRVITFISKLPGVLKFFGVESPFRLGSSTPVSSDQQKPSRQQLLQHLERDIDRRLATSLYKHIKLDLGLDVQPQQVGKPKTQAKSLDKQEDSTNHISWLNKVFISNIRNRKKHSASSAPTQKIIDLFDQAAIQGKLLIFGKPGSGKTTELLKLAKALVERATKDESLPIPLILELSTWSKGQPLEKWIVEAVEML